MKKLLLGLSVFSFVSCNLFEKEERLIHTLSSTDGKVVKFYYVALGATTNDVIQIRKVDKDKETIVQAYEHNFLNSARFITNDSLRVILSDTTLYRASKVVDTIMIYVK